MHRCLRNPYAKRLILAFVLTMATLLPSRNGIAAEDGSRPLQLEVYINDTPTKLIGSFTQLADRRMTASRRELSELGLKVPGAGNADDLVIIDNFPDVAYIFDEQAQKIFFKVGDALRMTKRYDASNGSAGRVPARTDTGAVLNYDIFSATNNFSDPNGQLFGGTSLTLDGRAFSQYGTLSQSAILLTSFNQQAEAIRLNSTYAYTDQTTLTTYRAGDAISGGLAWTRPIRIGGFQAQRNFGVRPDLVTLPLPSVTGTAAVPSTVDVYINNMKTFSQNIGTGPYQISNIPVVTGGGIARVVLSDSSGHQTVSSQPFYASSSLLAPGLLDFSVEAGLPRVSYGTTSDSYVSDPVASVNLRRGIFDWLTIESHAETGNGLVNGGAGAVVRLGATGALSGAVAASHQTGNTGLQPYLSYETYLLGVRINASTQRTFGPYQDLAAVTARFQPNGLPSLLGDTSPPKQLDRISIGLPPLSFDRKSSLSFSFINLVLASNVASRILSVSWSRQLSHHSSVFATAFTDIGDTKNTGIFAGLSMQFGDISTMNSVSGGSGGTNINFEAVKPLSEMPGSYGWNIRDSEGNAQYRSAAASYRSSYGRVEATVANDRSGTRATGEVDGAVTVMGGGVFLSNRIDDAFAVVDAGAPGVDVLYENRLIGKTNAQGQFLIPSLRSYQKNKIAIDPRDLPVNADAPMTQDIVAPADRSGVVVGFGVKTNVKAAIVVLADKTGKLITPGSRGKIEGGGEPFVVGYDGRAYVKGLSATNTVVISDGTNECRVSFPFTPRKNAQVVIGPVVCE